MVCRAKHSARRYTDKNVLYLMRPQFIFNFFLPCTYHPLWSSNSLLTPEYKTPDRYVPSRHSLARWLEWPVRFLSPFLPYAICNITTVVSYRWDHCLYNCLLSRHTYKRTQFFFRIFIIFVNGNSLCEYFYLCNTCR